MSLKISVEDIARLYRRGSDIDLQAIFGGHISGKRSQNGKINPMFLDGMLSGKKGDNQLNIKNGLITGHPSNGIDPKIYKNISTRESESEPKIGVIDMESAESVRENSQESSSKKDSCQESLKVTNGDVCVGDIVIENGYKNPGFESEGDGLYSVIRDIKNSKEDTNDYEIQKTKETENKENDFVTSLSGNVTIVNHKEDTVVNISDRNTSNHSDWPEIDDLVLSDVDHNQNKKESPLVEKSTNLVATLSEGKGDNHVIVSSSNHLTSDSVSVNQTSVSTVEQIKNEKNSPKNSKNMEEKENILHNSEKKIHKSILVTSCSVDENEQDHNKKPNGTVTEHKSVKFTEDTVDNEEKPKKYKKEKIFVSNIYRGRITNNTAVAKTNPTYLEDDELERSLTDDEKAARYSFRKIRAVESQYGDQLNIPAYMQEYVLGTSQMSPTNMSVKTIKTKMDSEIENLGEVPAGYNKLIKRTVAKERRNKIVRLTLAILAFLVVVAAVVLIVVFLGKPKS